MSFSSLSQPPQRAFVFALVRVAGVVRRILTSSNGTYKLLFLPGFEALRWRLGKWRAWFAFERARREVPAYRDFLAAHGRVDVRATWLDPDLTAIPVTDKASYVKQYSIEARCRGGRLPAAGAVIDESSGTSGVPNNWVRGPHERAEVKQALQLALHHQLGKEPLFVINAFALGPWATGMNVSMSVVDIAVLKSTGPDIAKIESTLRLFGPEYRYVITGYPPFLKTLVDTADVDWPRYDLTAIYGGEGMSEGMRTYLGRVFRRVYGSYGASDLEINIAGENDFTIALRRLLAERHDLRERLLRVRDAGLPMIFQYNPIDYHVESSPEGELVVTLGRAGNASPKIRYNIRDLGHVIRFPELKRLLATCGIAPSDLAAGTSDLPLLFLYGRADDALAYYGCKVTPTDVEAAVFSLPALAAAVNSFALVVSEDEQANKLLTIALELAQGREAPGDLAVVRRELLERLEHVNQDYREAARFMPEAAVPALELHRFGEGPFAGGDIRLKKHYVQRKS
jgi:phenylacetate-CoA ligase